MGKAGIIFGVVVVIILVVLFLVYRPMLVEKWRNVRHDTAGKIYPEGLTPTVVINQTNITQIVQPPGPPVVNLNLT